MPTTPDTAALRAMNQRYCWHPFTQMQDWLADSPLVIARGEGIYLYDTDDKRYYDGISSLWVNVHGHRVPEIDAAIRAQLDQVAHSTMLGFANVPATLLAERLVKLAPPSIAKVFYSDSGSTAVEIALKMAYQYWRHLGQPQRRQFVKMTNAYHGDTIGSVSIGGMPLFHEAFGDLLFDTLEVPYPHAYRFDGDADACAAHCLLQTEMLLREHGDTVIGLVVEPLVQGAAGMVLMPPGFLKALATLCREQNVLLICDEVATGFGRTGKLFACEHEKVSPDIMTVAKGLSGGYLPLAATLTSQAIFDAFLGDYSELKTFFHGHSFTGNPLGCAAALATLDLIESRDTIGHVARLEPVLAAMMEPLHGHPRVGDIRQRGFMVGIELVKDRVGPVDYDWTERMGVRVCRHAVELGLLLRPLGNVVVFMPPLASTEDELAAMVAIMIRAIRETTER